MRFELLGPLKVLEGESEVTPARPKQRALLSLLLLRRGEVVPGAQLIDALWGEEPPGTAQTALHGHVSTLRKLIGADRIETRPPGYSLQVAQDEVDVGRFESLVAAARSLDDPGERSTGLRAALALWHGEPLVELRGEPFAEREIARLEELRLAALEDRIDADLALGRHRELVAELEPLVAEHVFRERPRGQLMLALYRCGRQADALHVFQRGRGALVEELGIEPGPALQELQLRILRHDPSLELSAHPPAPGPPPVRDALKIAYAPWAGEPERSPLVGRDGELEQLGAALRRAESGSAATVLVAGEGGIGKTRLAKAVAARARAAGFRVLAGRCLDLVGPELPYLPFAEALRPLVTALPFAEAGSQWRGFEQTLALLDGLAAEAPLLLVLEDLHWADASTLDLVAYLAHSLGERRVLLLGTCRPDEPPAAGGVRRLADGVQRAAGGRVLELGPLEPADVTALLGPRAGARAQAIVARAEGNPFFAEELLAAAGDDGLPRGLRDLLLARVARLDRPSKGVVRLAAAAGREVEYALLRAAAGLPDEDVQASLRAAVEHGVLVADQPTRRFRFRHALLAEAVYSTLLPGEREEAHARLAEALARADPPAAAGELAPHWAAARRPREALVASIAAAREAEAVFGLAEALGHLERALAQWDAVPDAPALAGLDHAALASWAAEQAVLTGAAPRAVELGGQAIALVGDDPVRAGLLHARLGRYLNLAGRRDASLAAFQRAVALVPQAPPSAERAQVLAALGHILMLVWRHEASRATSEQALRLARAVGARAAENRALIVLGVDLAYLGHGDEGLTLLRQALRMAVEDGPPEELFRAYTCLTDVLTMLGRPRESARLAAEGAAAVRRYGIEHGTLVGNQVEALLASGEWDAADDVSAAALRANTANWPHHALTVRAAVETGRGDFDAARAHLEAALASVRDDDRGSRNYDPVVVELALWERRWSDAADAVRDALPRAEAPDAALFRVQLCAHGLRAEAELALAGDAAAVHRARELLAAARRAATDAAAVTPNAAGWRALAEAEYGRACDLSSGHAWSDAAAAWERLERPPLVAYCRWRQAEALSAAGADATAPLDEARAVAAAIGARPLLRELERLAAG